MPNYTLTEIPLNANTAVVVDDYGTERYKVIHPHYHDGTKWVKSLPELKTAEPQDKCELKCSTGMDLYGLSVSGWFLGLKKRSTQTQYLATPYAVTTFDDIDSSSIMSGIIELAPKKIDQIVKDGTKAKWDKVFKEVELEARIEAGGNLAIHHKFSKAIRETIEKRYYGVIWEYNDLGYISEIAADQEKGCSIYSFDVDGKHYFVEYFPEEYFRDRDENLELLPTCHDFEHDYTTASGTLGANLVLERGSTYYLSANVSTAGYHITTSGTTGRITVKTVGNASFLLNGAGTIDVSYIDFTSRNDDSRGETIAGSSGSPAINDQTVSYVRKTATTPATSNSITNFSFNYCTVNNSCIVGWSAGNSNDSLTLVSGIFDYCATAAASTTNVTFIGHGAGGSVISPGALTVRDVVVTSNCSSGGTSSGGVPSFAFLAYTYAAQTYQNISFLATGRWSRVFGSAARTISHTLDVQNCFASGDIANCIVASISSTSTHTATVSGCTFLGSNSVVSRGVTATQSAGTLNVTVKDCILNDFSGTSGNALFETGTVTFNHTYNIYYNNTNDCFEALGASEISGINPQLGSLPSGCVISSGYFLPDGYAVGNLAIEFSGSTTFNSGSIAEEQYTSTGYRYSGDKKITPGVMYSLSTFPEAITALVPSSGLYDGNTNVTASVIGAGSTSGTFTLDGSGVTVTGWSDTSIGLTAPPHATGYVTASYTNYRGATATLSSGFLYYVELIPPITSGAFSISITPTTGYIPQEITITPSGSRSTLYYYYLPDGSWVTNNGPLTTTINEKGTQIIRVTQSILGFDTYSTFNYLDAFDAPTVDAPVVNSYFSKEFTDVLTYKYDSSSLYYITDSLAGRTAYVNFPHENLSGDFEVEIEYFAPSTYSVTSSSLYFPRLGLYSASAIDEDITYDPDSSGTSACISELQYIPSGHASGVSCLATIISGAERAWSIIPSLVYTDYLKYKVVRNNGIITSYYKYNNNDWVTSPATGYYSDKLAVVVNLSYLGMTYIHMTAQGGLGLQKLGSGIYHYTSTPSWLYLNTFNNDTAPYYDYSTPRVSSQWHSSWASTRTTIVPDTESVYLSTSTISGYQPAYIEYLAPTEQSSYISGCFDLQFSLIRYPLELNPGSGIEQVPNSSCLTLYATPEEYIFDAQYNRVLPGDDLDADSRIDAYDRAAISEEMAWITLTSGKLDFRSEGDVSGVELATTYSNLKLRLTRGSRIDSLGIVSSESQTSGVHAYYYDDWSGGCTNTWREFSNSPYTSGLYYAKYIIYNKYPASGTTILNNYIQDLFFQADSGFYYTPGQQIYVSDIETQEASGIINFVELIEYDSLLYGVGEITSSVSLERYTVPSPPMGASGLVFTPILMNKRRYIYRTGTDYLQLKLVVYKGKYLYSVANTPVELWLNYNGSWQKCADYTTNRFGCVDITYSTSDIPAIDCCLGLARVVINGLTYNSNLVRLNFG